jgi:hypothetical protein
MEEVHHLPVDAHDWQYKPCKSVWIRFSGVKLQNLIQEGSYGNHDNNKHHVLCMRTTEKQTLNQHTIQNQLKRDTTKHLRLNSAKTSNSTTNIYTRTLAEYSNITT